MSANTSSASSPWLAAPTLILYAPHSHSKSSIHEPRSLLLNAPLLVCHAPLVCCVLASGMRDPRRFPFRSSPPLALERGCGRGGEIFLPTAVLSRETYYTVKIDLQRERPSSQLLLKASARAAHALFYAPLPLPLLFLCRSSFAGGVAVLRVSGPPRVARQQVHHLWQASQGTNSQKSST